MKHTPLIGLMLFLLVAGCVQTTPPIPNPGNGGYVPSVDGEWWYFAPIQAPTNPWEVTDIQFIKTPTQTEMAQAWLSTSNIFFIDAFFLPRDVFVCQALNCPRGDYLIVYTKDTESKKALDEMGFAPMDEPFSYITNAQGENAYAITFINPTQNELFYGGCNEFIWEKMSLEGTVPISPKTCVWEGIPSVLAPYSSVTFEGMLSASGEYRARVEFGVNCLADQPLSEAECEYVRTSHSNPITLSVSSEGFSILKYSLKQCNTNPWQVSEVPLDKAGDQVAFQAWLLAQGINPNTVNFVPAPNGFFACTACDCATGSAYQIVIPPAQEEAAKELGFTYIGTFSTPAETPEYALLEWYIYFPFQCYANPWKVPTQAVISNERDIHAMEAWLEGMGVDVKELTFINGFNLDNKCTVKSNKTYGIGVSDAKSIEILEDLLFVKAGKEQLERFTSTENMQPLSLFYSTKFCSTPPWGEPELVQGMEEEVQQRVVEWLAERGILPYSVSIHSVPISFSKECDTESGLGVYIEVPTWTETHLGADGFLRPSVTFKPTQTQLYPPVASTD